jgi:hypothetical protein
MARPQANMSGRKFTKEISVSEGKPPEMFESPFHRNIRNPQVATTGIGEVFSRTSQANGAKVLHGRHAVEFDESEVESPAGGANGSAQSEIEMESRQHVRRYSSALRAIL